MLTSLSNLKARLNLADADVQDDAFLSSLLALVSARFERECNRSFAYLDNATDDFPGDELELRVSRYPIDESVPIAFQLLTSAAVPMLVAGSGIQFEGRGEHELKGVPGTWHLFAVKP